MSEYISERYAGILTKEDISQLFNRLTEIKKGNRSEATRQCGLTGKATYDWENAAYLKLATKQKVLDACLKADFINTTDYLLTRSNERTVDVLRTLLSTIYSRAVEVDAKEQFNTCFNKFENLRTQYRGLIKDKIDDEVNDMNAILKQIALELELPVPPRTLDDISTKELLDIVPLIVDIYMKNPQEVQNIANVLDFPKETVEKLLSTFEKIRLAKERDSKLMETFESEDSYSFFGYQKCAIAKTFGTLTPEQTPQFVVLDSITATSKSKAEKQIPITSTENEEKCWSPSPSKYYVYCK